MITESCISFYIGCSASISRKINFWSSTHLFLLQVLSLNISGSDHWFISQTIDKIRIPRRPWGESLLSTNARLMRGTSLGNTKKHVENYSLGTGKPKQH